MNPPYACLLCDAQLESLSLLAAHVYEVHGIDMAEVLSSEPVMEKKKKLPNLVKITDLKPRPDKDQGCKLMFLQNNIHSLAKLFFQSVLKF